MPAFVSPKVPCVLAIGGLDPGGGAGILADARAIAAAGAFGCAAVSVLTVQSTSGMKAATPVARAELIAECTEVVRHQRVRAIKVGALGSEENTRAIADFLAIHRDIPAVVDTVMVPTRGRARLLDEKAITFLRTRILPRAALVTVNAPEAEVLTGRRVTRLDEAQVACLALVEAGARAVLLKGGHLGGRKATDLLAFAPEPVPPPTRSARSLARAEAAKTAPREPRLVELSSERLKLSGTHGGGCILASLIAGHLAAHDDDGATKLEARLEAAVRWSKKTHHRALTKAADVGGDLRVLFA